MMLYPPWNRTASADERRRHYEAMRDEIASHRQSVRVSGAKARRSREKAEEATESKKATDKKLLHLTKKQKATEEGKKAGYWSGAAAISVTILYETFKVAGFPGGHRWRAWWEHEAIYGALMWATTLIFGWLYKVTQDD